MKLTKSLLLASAAGLAAVATASAADLPSKKAAPVEYVKVCPAFGPGFFYIPGSDTCLKVGGTLWFEGAYAQPYVKSKDQLGYRTNLTVSLDARVNTEYGLLRTVVAPQMAKRSGYEQSGSQEREGNAVGSSGTTGVNKQTFFNAKGYIQFGGLTVGRTDSFFSNQFGTNDLVGSTGIDARDPVQTIAYTFALGNGITVTGAIEDSTDSSRDGIYSVFGGAKTAAAVSDIAVNGVVTKTGSAAVGTVVNYGGNRIPDAVLALKIDQAWGSANIAASSHAINYDSNQFSVEYGWATQAAVKVNLPMLGAGDTLFLNGVYASGYNQAVFRNLIGDRNSQDTGGWTGYNGGWNATATLNDVVVDETTGKTYQAKAWGLTSEFTHTLSPTVSAFVGGGYASLSWDQAAKQTVNINPVNTYNVYLGAVWTPVKGFSIVPQVEYAKISAKTAFAPSGAEPSTKNLDDWQARIRVTRSF